MVNYRLADFDRAAEAFEQAVELAERSDDLALEVRALRGCGQVRYRLGDYDTALTVYTQARRMAVELGDEAAAAIDHQIGKVLYRKQQLGEARSVLVSVRNVRSAPQPHRHEWRCV
jgi:tetratricopeptide (TPR) repeat protein